MKFLKNVNNGILTFYAIGSAIVLAILTDWYDKQNFFGGMGVIEHYGLIFAIFLVLASVFLVLLKWLALYEEQNDVNDNLSVSFLVGATCALFYPFAIFKLVQLIVKPTQVYIDEKVLIIIGFVLLSVLGAVMSVLSVRIAINVKERLRRFGLFDGIVLALLLIFILFNLMPSIMLNSAWLVIIFAVLAVRFVYLFFVMR
ncbi:hypothetical protein ACFLZ7_00085 [Nanoarchaeota archaeon]